MLEALGMSDGFCRVPETPGSPKGQGEEEGNYLAPWELPRGWKNRLTLLLQS